MDIERQKRIRSLMFGALDRDTSERAAWLREACGDDQDLHDTVAALLELDPEDFIQPPILVRDPRDLIGQRIGGFRLIDVIGAGGMGVVFRARQKDPERDVALKVLRQFAGDDGVHRFDDEVRYTEKLDHPGIVRVIASGVDGKFRWYAMDLVEGWSLQDLMNLLDGEGPAPKGALDLHDPRAVATIVRQVLDALQHAHDRDIVHRDIKPGNILVDRAGRVRLTDFGLACDLSQDRTCVQVAGTLAYMSPEQAVSLRNAADTRSDLYSTGAVLYALLRGRPPYAGGAGAELLMKILRDPPAPLSKCAPRVDRRLAQICSTAIRRNRKERYTNAAAMRDDLDRWLEGGRVLGRPLSVGERIRGVCLNRRAIPRRRWVERC